MGGYQLSVDFGTSSTVAVLAGPDGEHHPLLFDGEEFLPSAACLDNAPHLLVGRDALALGQAHPDRLAAYPKRALDRGAVILGGVECPVGDLYAAVFARVAAEARRVAGEPMTTVTLTHPACWDRRRQATLTRAAAKVGLGPTRLVAEPVAAALHAADSDILQVADGASVIVYDLGAGTFDAAVVRRHGPTFDVLAQRGLPDAGGLDLDAAIVAHLGGLLADDTIRWDRLSSPQTVEDRRAARRLLDEVRAAKELLSRADATAIQVPLFEEAVPLSRAALERIARPLLDRTVAATVAAVTEAGISSAEVAGVLLTGGSSRIPLVARLLRDALGLEPTAVRRPKLAVADGCLPVRPRTAPRRPRRAPAAPAPSPAASSPSSSSPGASSSPSPSPSGEAPDAGVPPFEAASFGTAKTTKAAPPRPAPLIVEAIDVLEQPPSLLDRFRRRRPPTGPSIRTWPATPTTAPRAAPTGWATTTATPGGWATAAASAAATKAAAANAAAQAADRTTAAAGAAPANATHANLWNAEPGDSKPGDAHSGEASSWDAKPPQAKLSWTKAKVVHVAKVAAGTLVGSAVAVAAGIWVGFAVAPAETFSTIQVGQCIRQDGAEARRVDCTETDAYTVTARVFPAGACPDPAQPFAMQEQTQLCLVPAAARPAAQHSAGSRPIGPRPADPRPTSSTRHFGP